MGDFVYNPSYPVAVHHQDQTVPTGDHAHVEDTRPDLQDDGRTLREGALVYNPGYPVAVHEPGSRPVILFRRGKLVADAVHIRSGPFQVSEWESLYSNVFALDHSEFSVASFAPVVDDQWRVVGHLGWADGNDILVPESTLRNDRLFWSILQTVRLGEWRRQLLNEADRFDRDPFPNSPFPRPATSSPAPKDGKTWRGPEKCAPSRPGLSLDTRWDEARRGPLKEDEMAQYLRDLDCFVQGGGEVSVGRHFQARGHAPYLKPYPGRPDGEVGSPKKALSSGYEFLVLVDPEGHVQGVMDARKNLKTQHEMDAEIFLGVFELMMTLSMVIEIAPLVILVFRAGLQLARVAVQAIKLIAKRERKEILERVTILTEARMAEVLGGVAESERGPLVQSPNMNISRDTAGTGQIRAITGVRAADGSQRITVQGFVGPSLPERLGFERRLVSGSDLGMGTYQRLHLWGRRLGDEAAAGIWLGPRGVNIGEQARVESLLEDLATKARANGGTVQLRVTGVTHPTEALPAHLRAHDFLSEVTYEYKVVTPGQEVLNGRITIGIGPPPNGSVQMLGADAFDSIPEVP